MLLLLAQVVMQSLDKWLDLFLAEHSLSALHSLPAFPEAACHAPWTPAQVLLRSALTCATGHSKAC